MARLYGDVGVRQTHLPTTIAGGCAGFLSRDKRASERAESGRSPARAETCYYTRMRKRRTGALRGSRKLLKMHGAVSQMRPPFVSNKHLPGVARGRREDGAYVPGPSTRPGVSARRHRLFATRDVVDGNRVNGAVLRERHGKRVFPRDILPGRCRPDRKSVV